MISKIVSWNILIVILVTNCLFIDGYVRDKRAVIAKSAQRWTDGVIPYYIDKDFFKTEEIMMINDAINTWNMETCVNFRLKEDDDKNWVKITGGTNCHSFVGMNDSGEQEINLASPDCQFFGTYLHELGHTIGLHHEHVRPDRESHLHINKENIKYGHEDFYEKVHHSELLNYDLPFDIQSIMLYGAQSFVGSDGDTTINVKNKSLSHLLDEVHNKDISFYDAMVVNLFYKCADLCKSDVTCPQPGYVDKYCQCHVPESFELRRCQDKNDEKWCNEKKNIGKCELDLKYMSVNCRKTCDRCFKHKNKFKIRKQICKNLEPDSKCDGWARRGECERNNAYMKITCKKSCGICKVEEIASTSNFICNDEYTDGRCEKWKSIGECELKKSQMEVKCPKTCNFCKIKSKGRSETQRTTVACRNLYSDSDCTSWANSGECKNNPGFMMKQCSKSCGACSDEQNLADSLNTSPEPVVCKNVKSQCERLSKGKKCKTDYVFMSVNCAQTCNACYIYQKSTGCRNLDNDKNCEEWSKNGNCSTNANYLMVQCARSCGRCTTDTYKECKNLYKKELCRVWVKLGECYKNPFFMLNECAQSCGSCDLREKNISNFICKNIINEELCYFWKSEGECQKNREFMMENCGKTCGICQPKNQSLVGWKKCRNRLSDKFCERQRRNGFCKIKSDFMKKNCAKSCKFCKPSQRFPENLNKCQNVYNNKVCTKWKTAKECKRNRIFMKQMCAESCGFCKKSMKKGECKNIYIDSLCQQWAQNNKCQTNSLYMLKMCAQACNNCSLYSESLKESSNCVNTYNNESCNKWSKTGECMKNPAFMLKSCAWSCNYCSSKESFCRNKFDDGSCNKWSINGECSKNPDFMLINCAKSCSNCSSAQFKITTDLPKTLSTKQSSLSTCDNLYRDDICMMWKSFGYCVSNPILMRTQCRNSCGSCKKSLECQNVFNDKVCEDWAKMGKCNKNMKFLLTLCMKSCGRCSLTNFKIDDSEKNTSHKCENKYGELSCEAWRDIGECEKNPTFMSENCAKSCGTCKEQTRSARVHKRCRNIYRDSSCNEWAKNGQCNNSTILPFVCAKACNSCGTFYYKSNNTLKCKNLARNTTCDKWKLSGHCETKSSFMTKKCALTCNKCEDFLKFLKKLKLMKNEKPKTLCKNTAGNAQCSYWARQGQCESNPSYMSVYCRKACDACQTKSNETNICEDSFSTLKCQLWAEKGECSRNQAWMSENCAKSCVVCQMKKKSEISQEKPMKNSEN